MIGGMEEEVGGGGDSGGIEWFFREDMILSREGKHSRGTSRGFWERNFSMMK
jgi:hypothetical protein